MLDRILSARGERLESPHDASYTPAQAVTGASWRNKDADSLAVIFPPWHCGGWFVATFAGRLASRVRAGMRLAQLKLVELLYSKKSLPQTPATAESAYCKLLKHATATNEATRPFRTDRRDSAIEVRGLLGEMAVLLLAQRIALRGEASDRWLALQSSFSEDHGGDCLVNTGAPAWDLDVFTPGQDAVPKLAYTLQVKSANLRPSSPTAPTVYINPDLALCDGESGIISKVIEECNAEISATPSAAPAAERLDRRTTQLLARL